MEWVETTAKSVEEAKELALDTLHVDEADAEFEVLEEPRPGLFGRVRGEARVRARVLPVQPRPKVERRERRRPARKSADSAGRAPVASGEPTDTPAVESQAADATAPSRSSATKPARSRARSAANTGDRATRAAAQSDQNDAPTETEPTVNNDSVTVQEQAEMIHDFVEGLVEAFGYEAEVSTVEVDEETAEVHVAGSDLGLLVGPRGNTLQAIHDLSRTVVQRRATGNHEGRVHLDVAGYRQRRREALERFTHKIADEVLSTGVEQVLEPMSAADRKVVHDTVNDIAGVRTTSEGEDARRHVVLLPDER